jgi:hypothetical protein
MRLRESVNVNWRRSAGGPCQSRPPVFIHICEALARAGAELRSGEHARGRGGGGVSGEAILSICSKSSHNDSPSAKLEGPCQPSATARVNDRPRLRPARWPLKWPPARLEARDGDLGGRPETGKKIIRLKLLKNRLDFCRKGRIAIWVGRLTCSPADMTRIIYTGCALFAGAGIWGSRSVKCGIYRACPRRRINPAPRSTGSVPST